MDEGDEGRARRRAAVRACERVLTQVHTETLRERLARGLADAERAGYDLEEGPDFYGDGVVRAVEQRVAGLLGTEDAAFFPTGTMAQQAALRAWAGRTGNDVVALHPLAHPEVHERDALHTVTRLRTVHPTTAARLPDADEVRDFEEPPPQLRVGGAPMAR